MQINSEAEQISMLDLDLLSGKTCPEPSPAELPKAKTSGSCWKKWSELKAIPFQSLDLNLDAGNLLGEFYWERISPWLGGSLILNTGPAPLNAADVSSLSQILEERPPRKYYLSRKACQGILRRASEREKELPDTLKRALETQSGMAQSDGKPIETEAYHINQRDEGINLHGVSGALMATNNMQMQTFVTQSAARDQPGKEKCRPEPVIYENHGIDSRYRDSHGISPTLAARCGTGGNNLPLVSSDHHAIFSRQRVDEFKSGDVVSTQSARQHKDATDLVLFGQNQFAGYDESCATLRAEGGDMGGGSENLVVDSNAPAAYLIRRLTPLECERLQGFPDGWTDMPNASDSARYKALGNSVAIPCVEYIMQGISAVYGNMKEADHTNVACLLG